MQKNPKNINWFSFLEDFDGDDVAEHTKFYTDKCRVYVIEYPWSDLGKSINMDVICVRCNERYGKHSGVRCVASGHYGAIFVPGLLFAGDPAKSDWFEETFGL